MKKIMNGVIYDTEKAELIAENWNGLGRVDINFVNEEIYCTKNKRYFLYAEGGANSCHCQIGMGYSTFGETIEPLNDDELYALLERWNSVELIEDIFPDRIELA